MKYNPSKNKKVGKINCHAVYGHKVTVELKKWLLKPPGSHSRQDVLNTFLYLLLTHFQPIFHLWINQVVGLH